MEFYPNQGLNIWNNIILNYEKLNLIYIKKQIIVYLKEKICKNNRSIFSLSRKNFILLSAITLIDEILNPIKNYSLLCVSSNIYTFKKINTFTDKSSLLDSSLIDMDGKNLQVYTINTENTFIHNKYLHLIII